MKKTSRFNLTYAFLAKPAPATFEPAAAPCQETPRAGATVRS